MTSPRKGFSSFPDLISTDHRSGEIWHCNAVIPCSTRVLDKVSKVCRMSRQTTTEPGRDTMRSIEEIIASRPVAVASKKGVVSKAAAKLASQQRQWWWQGLTSDERRAVERYDDEQAAIRMAQPEDPRIIAARVAQMERSIVLGADELERMTQEDRDLMREDLGDYSHHMR